MRNGEGIMNARRKRIVAVAGVALVAAGLALWAGIGRPEAAKGQTAGSSGQALGITVTGVGTVSARPDRADFTFGVETQGKTADEALAANSAAVQKVIQAIKGAGVAGSDIQTQQVSVYPRYSNDGQTIVGFTATNSVTAKIRDVSKAGAVVEAAVKAGANQVYGPTFSISNQSTLYKDALDDAFGDARAKAQALAGITGVTLGRVINVVEGGGFIPFAGGGEEAAPAAEPPVEPGLQDIQATLTVTFAIS
jgi:uncharacterized protein YggE